MAEIKDSARGTVQRRSTNQRATITGALAEMNQFVSAQDLHGHLRQRGSTVGLATVYRALQDLVVGGSADSLRNESGEVLYRHCNQPTHHHHLVCRSCGRTEEIDAPNIEKWARTVADTFGYVEVDHQIELFGICAECAKLR